MEADRSSQSEFPVKVTGRSAPLMREEESRGERMPIPQTSVYPLASLPDAEECSGTAAADARDANGYEDTGSVTSQ